MPIINGRWEAPPDLWDKIKEDMQNQLKEKKEADAARYDPSGKVILPSEKAIQYTRENNNDIKNELLGLKSPISIENLEGLFQNIKQGKVDFTNLSFDTKELITAYILKNKGLPDLYIMLSEENRTAGDTNRDGIISDKEYSDFKLSLETKQKDTRSELQKQKKIEEMELLIAKNTKDIHFDYTVFLMIGLICLTAVIITWLLTRKKSP